MRLQTAELDEKAFLKLFLNQINCIIFLPHTIKTNCVLNLFIKIKILLAEIATKENLQQWLNMWNIVKNARYRSMNKCKY